MTPSQFYKTYKDADRERIAFVCKKAGTSLENFKQIALGHGGAGKQLAKRLAVASDNEMSLLEILYPEDYGCTAA